MTKTKRILASLLVLIMCFSLAGMWTVAQAGDGNAYNGSLALSVNSSGCFSLGTNGGVSDTYKTLLCGFPGSSTSYTTVKLDDDAYEYGANNGYFDANSHISYCDYGGVFVKQRLTLVGDLLEVCYYVTNNDSQDHNVGLRIMMDTDVAYNDYAPFSIPGVGDITTQTEFTGSNVPDVYYCKDDLENPSLIAQGKLISDNPPDKVQFTNWRQANNEPWDAAFHEGASIGDSAVLVIWDQSPLAQGETRTYVTYYGFDSFVEPWENTLAVTPSSWNPPAAGASTTLTVNCNASWTADSYDSWLTVSSDADDTLTLTATANTGDTRTGTVYVWSRDTSCEIAVTQDGIVSPPPPPPPVSLEVTPTTWNPTAAASSTTVTVTSDTSWTAESNASWLTASCTADDTLALTSWSTADDTLTLAVTRNTGAARTGTVTVTAGNAVKTITVTQSAAYTGGGSTPTPSTPTPTPEPVITFTDEDTGVTIDADAGVLPSDTVLNVNLVTEDSEEYPALQAALSEDVENVMAYNVTLLSKGVEIQPNGIVKVTMPIPEGYDPDLVTLYHYGSDGSLSEVSFTLSDDKKSLTFEADSFSIYAIALLKNTVAVTPPTEKPVIEQSDEITTTAQPPAATPPKGNTPAKGPQTGDTANMMMYMLLFALSATGLLLIALTYKRDSGRKILYESATASAAQNMADIEDNEGVDAEKKD